MGIPVWTALMDIYRLDPDTSIEDRGDEAYEVIESDVKCHLSSPGDGRTFTPERTSTSLVTRLTSDVTDLQAGDRILIQSVFYDVHMAYTRLTGPLPHTSAQVQVTEV